uniref:Ferritin n=1 Tax=Psorophora albipes TaxID=869069 RepID=T1DIQ4_9DIPT
MMKSIFFGVVAIAVAIMSLSQDTVHAQQQTGEAATVEGDYKWDNIENKCVKALHKQINEEFNAAIAYLTMGSYYRQEKINLIGFSDFFFKAAAEEREHGIKLMEYALMRGKGPVDKDSFNLDYSFKVEPGTDGEAGLKMALAKEEFVTNSIRGVIKACEAGTNDYHLADYLTGEYLEEQHKGQRELAEKIATLNKMKKSAPSLGEYLFDRTHM